MNDKNQVGDTIPLYEEVKRNLYVLFQELKNVSSLILSNSNIGTQQINMRLFNENYIKLYMEINTSNKIDKLNKNKSKYLDDAYDHIIKGKFLSRKQISQINIIITLLIEKLGISKIGSKKGDDWAF